MRGGEEFQVTNRLLSHCGGMRKGRINPPWDLKGLGGGEDCVEHPCALRLCCSRRIYVHIMYIHTYTYIYIHMYIYVFIDESNDLPLHSVNCLNLNV